MKIFKYKKLLAKLAFVAMLPAMAGLTSCSEDIDQSNLYTFTGETIEDYLSNRSDQFSSFNYILTRAGMDKILSAYGTYTCFAPTNDAVTEYIDSLYDDTSNKDLPHNGMTARSLEGLSDSLCEDIALFHLANTEVMAIDMQDGMTIPTMLGRDLNTAIDSTSGNVVINSNATITSVDNELENGVLHVINHVISRSNRLIAGELERSGKFTIFSQALAQTGLADSLVLQKKASYDKVYEEGEAAASTYKFYVPKTCVMGYTVFAENDETLKANGINSFDDLVAYAKKEYENCAGSDGWYDYARDNNIQISTGTDYTNPWNTLNMFMRYHILKFKVPYDKLVYDENQVSKVSLFEYYETMLPYTLSKVMRVSGVLRLNRWVTNSSLTDRVAELASNAIQTVKQPGIEITHNTLQALNGYIHPIDGMLVYDKNVPQGVLNERMRFDDCSLFGEMMSNNLRCASDADIKALNGGQTGKDGALGGSYVRILDGFLDNCKIYNGTNTRLYYLPGQSNGWSNFQMDEFNCMGTYDFAFRLPPVPDGTYELRMGYTANGNRGMVQFYLGTSSAQTSMRALDIPLDMRVVPKDNADGSPDENTGWCLYTKTSDQGVETDQNMHNLGWMRGPLYYTLGKGGSTTGRSNAQDLRRVIVKQSFKQGEYWLRFKTVLPDNTTTQFHLDYIEFCPENVYNNTKYVEDMY